MIAGCPSLTKPSRPKEAIVRMVFKETVVNLEVKKPAGKWEKGSGQPYAKEQVDPTRTAARSRFETIPSFTSLMRDNKDRLTFARMTGKS